MQRDLCACCFMKCKRDFVELNKVYYAVIMRFHVELTQIVIDFKIFIISKLSGKGTINGSQIERERNAKCVN
jgi:hypothetical protein